MFFTNISGTARRCIGLLVLLPIVAAVSFDGRVATLAIMLVAVGMVHEFCKMIRVSFLTKLFLSLCILAPMLPAWAVEWNLWWYVFLALPAFFIPLIYKQLLVGVFAFALSLCFCFAFLLLDEPKGHWLILILAAAIAACDSVAYFAGRYIGGPKLASSVSPNKTISGSISGILAAIAVMVSFSTTLELDVFVSLLLGFVLAILSQMGDLLESALKRQANVKDSGFILPGHGGLLDRFDGYVLSLPGFYIFLFLIKDNGL